MKSPHTPQPMAREARMSKVNQRNGLAIALIILLSVSLENQNTLLSGILAIVAVGALIASFVSGYLRSDELQKLVQLKAAAISFVTVMFLTFVLHVLEVLNYTPPEDAAGTIFLIGFVLHMFLLPGIAKRAHEK